jgi:hypothetical protein
LTYFLWTFDWAICHCRKWKILSPIGFFFYHYDPLPLSSRLFFVEYTVSLLQYFFQFNFKFFYLTVSPRKLVTRWWFVNYFYTLHLFPRKVIEDTHQDEFTNNNLQQSLCHFRSRFVKMNCRLRRYFNIWTESFSIAIIFKEIRSSPFIFTNIYFCW